MERVLATFVKSRSKVLWKACAEVSLGSEDVLLEMLSASFGAGVTSYSDLETGTTTISIFLNSKQEWASEDLAQLSSEWRRLGIKGLSPLPNFELSRVRRRDWAESWKRHFRPLKIGNALEIRPPWYRTSPKPGCKAVILEPGLSFGTGHHPTTAFCLREIVHQRKRGGSFLDVGTGSGILAIAAAKLNYGPIQAFDFDPEAVRVALENARRNRVAERISFRTSDLAKLPSKGPKFDLICANLISTLLVQHRDRLLARLAPSGTLVIAGILATEFAVVRRHFESAGLKLVRSKAAKEWQSGCFRLSQSCC